MPFGTIGKRLEGCTVMTAGDASRIWFPEIVEALRAGWRPGLPCEGVVALRDCLQELLAAVRRERKLRPARYGCPDCGHEGSGAEAAISVRSMILALARFGIIDLLEMETAERHWQRYRRRNKLDRCGKQTGAEAIHQAEHIH
jgi:hypothetical protein